MNPRPIPTPSRGRHASWMLVALLAGIGCSSRVETPAAVTAATDVVAVGESGADESAASDSAAPAGAPGAFSDVTAAAGIAARHVIPGKDIENIVDSLGAGASFGDLDGDSWLDLVVLAGPHSPDEGGKSGRRGFHVYRNLRNGRFEDVTARSGIPAETTGLAAAIADYDGDGDRDLYVVDRGQNHLYRNRGDLSFEDVTEQAGVGDRHFGVGAVFFDMDGDGKLDLYVGNYVNYDPRPTGYYSPDAFPGPLAYRAEPQVLYRNRGDGTFEDVSKASGVAALEGRAMSVIAADFNGDGRIDIFQANDASQNFLLLNQGAGRFVEGALAAGVGFGENGEARAAMAADLGDVDGDGQLDLVVSDTAFGALFHRTGPGQFVDAVMQSGLAPLVGQHASWGQNLIDYDNDGYLDTFVMNGGLHHLEGWEAVLAHNTGNGRFEDASMDGGPYFATRRVGRASIAGDYDNDGDIDLFVTNLNDRPVLLRNDVAAGNSWITLDLVGLHGRDAFGARVELTAGGRTQVSEARCPSTYLGQSDPRLHFGLGAGVDLVERIRITWPGGAERVLEKVPARQILRVVEGQK